MSTEPSSAASGLATLDKIVISDLYFIKEQTLEPPELVYLKLGRYDNRYEIQYYRDPSPPPSKKSKQLPKKWVERKKRVERK